MFQLLAVSMFLGERMGEFGECLGSSLGSCGGFCWGAWLCLLFGKGGSVIRDFFGGRAGWWLGQMSRRTKHGYCSRTEPFFLLGAQQSQAFMPSVASLNQVLHQGKSQSVYFWHADYFKSSQGFVPKELKGINVWFPCSPPPPPPPNTLLPQNHLAWLHVFLTSLHAQELALPECTRAIHALCKHMLLAVSGLKRCDGNSILLHLCFEFLSSVLFGSKHLPNLSEILRRKKVELVEHFLIPTKKGTQKV